MRIIEVVKRHLAAEQFGSAKRVTLLLLVLYGAEMWQQEIPVTIWAAVGLVYAPALDSRLFWACLALFQYLSIAPHLYVLDNHQLLMAYWTAALACAGRNSRLLQLHSRLLLGLCFFLAFVWKLLGGEYLDGSFLEYTMLTDERFFYFARWIGGVDQGDLLTNTARLHSLFEGETAYVSILGSPRATLVAWVGSYWTLVSEGMIAFAFLRIGGDTLWRWRHGILLQFMIATYPVATVIGFAWLLTIMGWVQCGKTERGWLVAYAVLLALLQLFRVPWGDLVS